MEKQGLDNFIHGYYASPDPARAPEALLCAAELGYDERKDCVWYFFARIAEDHPAVLREYERLFQTNQIARPLLLLTLGESGDSRTLDFLQASVEDPAYSREREDIQSLVANWSPGRTRPLGRPAASAYDLDLLWHEFMVTGADAPVVAVIDVLDKLDIVRRGLQVYLDSRARSGVISRWQANRVSRKLTKGGVWIDAVRGEIVSPFDLDCYVSTEGGAICAQRLAWFRGALPFDLSEQDLQHVGLKASALWSLRANAQRHPAVLKVCVAEGARRTGRARLALLEIAARANLAVKDIASAFNRLHDSLTANAQARTGQLEEMKMAMDRLANLAESVAQQGAPVSSEKHGPIRSECAEETAKAPTYRAELSLRAEDESGASPESTMLRVYALEHSKPDQYRVSQSAGSDFDEWVIMHGKTFRGPAWLEIASTGELEVGEALRVDPYLALLRQVEPVSARLCESAGTMYLALGYDSAARPYLPFPMLRTKLDVTEALLWIALDSKYLVKARFRCSAVSAGAGPGTVTFEHCFASYGAPIEIIPPAFQLLQPTT